MPKAMQRHVVAVAGAGAAGRKLKGEIVALPKDGLALIETLDRSTRVYVAQATLPARWGAGRRPGVFHTDRARQRCADRAGSEAGMSETWQRGTITGLTTRYAFVRPDDGGRDVFISAATLKDAGLWWNVKYGSPVEYIAGVDPNGKAAVARVRADDDQARRAL
jgi:cold shock CspA family protein